MTDSFETLGYTRVNMAVDTRIVDILACLSPRGCQLFAERTRPETVDKYIFRHSHKGATIATTLLAAAHNPDLYKPEPGTATHALSGYLKLVRFLLENKANPNGANPQFYGTPLGNMPVWEPAVFRLLVEAKADVLTSRGPGYATPVIAIVWRYAGHHGPSLADTLVPLNLDWNAQTGCWHAMNILPRKWLDKHKMSAIHVQWRSQLEPVLFASTPLSPDCLNLVISYVIG